MGAIKDWNTDGSLHDWVTKAEAGDIEAQYTVARHVFYELEPGKKEKELIEKAVMYYRNAAMNGYFHGIAAEELGTLYYEGKYIEQDYQKAVMWFRTSINKLLPIGYFKLGQCFYYGHGVEQDYAKAFDSYFKGVMTGYINNVLVLADMYMNGVFVIKDEAFAIRLYQDICQDAELDHDKYGIWADAYGLACLRLGAAYLFGCGVEQDIDEANHQFSEAKTHEKNYRKAFFSSANAVTKELVSLMDQAPFHEGFIPEVTGYDETCNVKTAGAETDDLGTYMSLARTLLREHDNRGNIYENLANVYGHLTCFESDDGFIAHCHKKAVKTEKGKATLIR